MFQLLNPIIMNKSMKPIAALQRPLTEEEKKDQMMRAFIQKKASLAEGILFNLCQNPSLAEICEHEHKNAVEIADSMSDKFLKIIYKMEVSEKEG